MPARNPAQSAGIRGPASGRSQISPSYASDAIAVPAPRGSVPGYPRPAIAKGGRPTRRAGGVKGGHAAERREGTLDAVGLARITPVTESMARIEWVQSSGASLSGWTAPAKSWALWDRRMKTCQPVLP